MIETSLRAAAQPDSAPRGGASGSAFKGANRKFRIRRENSLDNLPTAWLALLENGVSSPFQTQSWLLPWYRIVGAQYSAKPLFVTVADARSGEPLMFFPLCIRPEGKLTIIEFPDLGVADYNAPLFAMHFEPDELQLRRILRGVFSSLPSADLLRLGKMPDMLGSRKNPLVSHGMFHRMPPRSRRTDPQMARTQFDENLPHSTGPITSFVEARTERDARRLFGSLCEQRQARCVELGRRNILDNPVYGEFYETVILSSLRSGFASLSSLQSDGEIVAVRFGLRHAAAYHLLMASMRSDRLKDGLPGKASNMSRVEISSACLDVAGGDESSMRDFGWRPRPLYECLRAQSIFGAPIAFATNVRSILRNGLRLAPQ